MLLRSKMDITGYDFSRLKLWQVYLQGLHVSNVNLAEADLTGALFSDTISTICAITFSSNGELFAATTINGDIHLWQTSDRRLVNILQGHTDAVWSVVFSPDGKTIASGSGDQTVRLWDVSNELTSSDSPPTESVDSPEVNQISRILRTSRGWVRCLGFSPDGLLLASGSTDRNVYLCDLASGQLRHTLTGHTDWVRSVAFRPHLGTRLK